MSYPQPGGPNMAGRFGAGGWGDQRAESRGAAASVLRASELAEQSKMASGGTDGRTEERREETDRRLVIAFSADAAGPREDGHWKDVQSLLQRIVELAQNWAILCPQERKQEFELKLGRLKSPGWETWEAAKLADPTKQDLINFLRQSEGREHMHIPDNLAPLLEEIAW
ncbi:hypothetical protein HU200_058785 [Digitaria exilis]|uniref:Uncharacterized protein n=1 Tax=Digitaria exilis TaxID=1010633 RepID=A0A835E336_9POAL|nr:hypothetical protein HU200_058785 [Digitaria exilis]